MRTLNQNNPDGNPKDEEQTTKIRNGVINFENTSELNDIDNIEKEVKTSHLGDKEVGQKLFSGPDSLLSQIISNTPRSSQNGKEYDKTRSQNYEKSYYSKDASEAQTK
jgi:hypothetical protein